MTKTFDAYFEMMNTVVRVVDEYTTVWTAFVPFSTAYNHFRNSVWAAFPAAITATLTGSKGATTGKNELRTSLEISVEVMAGQIALYAVTIGDSVLRAAARLTHTSIVRSTDDEMAGKAVRIIGLANAHIAALAPFGITPADVTALSAQTAAFSATIGTPKAAITARKEANANLENLRRVGMADLDVMDALMPLWKTSAPDFYSQYFAMRKIPSRGHRHRALSLRVKTEEGAPVAGAILRIDAARIRRITSPTGQVLLQHLKAGAYDALLSKEGYKDEALKVYISGDKGTVLEVVLQNNH